MPSTYLRFTVLPLALGMVVTGPWSSRIAAQEVNQRAPAEAPKAALDDALAAELWSKSAEWAGASATV